MISYVEKLHNLIIMVKRGTIMVALYCQCYGFREELMMIFALILFVAFHVSCISVIVGELWSSDESAIQKGIL